MGANYDPETAENWMSVSEDVEFLPLLNNKNGNNGNKARRKTRSLEEDGGEGETTGAWADYDPFSVQPFVEGMSEYDEYQQAWRMLGFMIDCNPVGDDDDYEASGGSGDEVTEEGCARYVLWAAVSPPASGAPSEIIGRVLGGRRLDSRHFRIFSLLTRRTASVPRTS